MDPILEQVYSTVMNAAPFVIAAYALIWIAILVFAVIMMMRARKTDQDIEALRDAIERLERKG